MSSLSIPRPKKVSDGQFIGDLTKLLERRKIKCGDPHSLETFGSELSSNDILRSDLFTLCTAISHMADEDLSGEQLLVLVARALGGPGISNGVAAVPDSVRSAFLTGYEAWSNRGNEMSEPLEWPPPRPAVDRSEPSATAQAFGDESEPEAVKIPATGLRTMQEALELAKKRYPMPMPAERSSALGANIERLTISELKTLLDEIEDRMSRLQPHLRELSSIVRSPAGDAKRRDPAQHSDAARSSRASAPSAESSIPFSSALRSQPVDDSRDPSAGVTAGLGSTSAALNETAFFERHPYLRPKRRAGADLRVVPIFDPAAGRAVAEPAPVAVRGVAAEPPAALAAPSPLAAPPPPPIPIPIPADGGETALSGGAAMPSDTYAAPNAWRVTRRMAGAVAAGFLMPTMFAGVIAYRYFYPPYAIKYPDPRPNVTSQAADLPAVPVAGVLPAASETPPAAASHPQVNVAASSARLGSRQQPPALRHGTRREDAARRAWLASQQPAAYVWPPPPQIEDGGASAMRAASSADPYYVPSSTMIEYAVSAPKPIYPVDRAKGAEGVVVLQITISRQGDVMSTRTVSGPVELRSAAVQAVRTWRFKPYLLDGNPTEVVTTLELPFNRP